MDLSGIISISGQPGLYKVVAQSKNGLIVESLIDKKRIPAYSSYKISALEDISVFTKGDDMPLSEVFQKIFDKEKGGAAIDHKADDSELRNYFSQALPEYDEDRVYISDIRKMISWYNLLHKNDLLKQKQEETAAEEKGEKKAKVEEKAKTAHTPKVKPKAAAKPVKTNAPKVKAAGVRKSGSA
jgi:hypothetical protein